MVAMASDSGTTSTSNRRSVITNTASDRFPHSRAWMPSITGQVATTTMVAQITAGRNGRNIRNEAAIRPPMKRTPRVIWARSRCCGFMFLQSGHGYRKYTSRATPTPRLGDVIAVTKWHPILYCKNVSGGSGLRPCITINGFIAIKRGKT